MRNDRKRWTIVLFSILVFLALNGVAAGQKPKSLVATANGEGTIRFGNEEFKIHAIVVKLFEDGKAEINLITDITVFVSGTWSHGEADKDIDLKITGGGVSGNLDGAGKLLLTEDRKSIAGLNCQVLNKTTRKIIKAEFTTKS